MSSASDPENSLINLFLDCRLSDDDEPVAGYQPLEATSQATQSQCQLVLFKSPCKAPQSQMRMSASSADADEIIVISDEPVVSYLYSSQMSSSSEEPLAQTYSDFIPETDDSRPVSPGALTDMDSRLKQRSPDRSLDKLANPTNRSVVTRSGRAVKVRMDKEFDYSSSQSKGDGEEDSDDDDDYQQALELKRLGRKRVSLEHSSSSACSTDTSFSSPEGAPTIYLQLGSQVALVKRDPLADLSLDDDEDLKTKVHKFLGLMAARRRLYNPADDSDPVPEEDEKVVSPQHVQCRLITPTPTKKDTASPKPIVSRSSMDISVWWRLAIAHRDPPTLEERQAKAVDDFVLQANANSAEEQTPDHLKTPIDLSELPSSNHVAVICRRHKESLICLKRHPLFYGFVESLNPKTPISMCHPMAVTYRESSFDRCKDALAKQLFNILNHAVFHCGLQAPINWKRGMAIPSLSELSVGDSGQRTARILLSERISQPAMLVKPLLHEMCHAAAFVFNRETGHGDNCRRWAYQAKHALPELPAIDDCEVTFKYTCSMCARCSYGRIQFRTEQLRCHYCQFEVGVKPFHQDDVYQGTRPDTTMTPFKSFVREHYLKLGERGGGTHSSKMIQLSGEYAEMNSPPDRETRSRRVKKRGQ
ncbi:uncharacterized protein LOC108097276 [Drosophila ficusphila]|uniref:uncharacterized protein LOC108097276 n=1 Tax=Drosophila ficusphila TaxID=30025 RepID=UPI0007E8599E|nr:uncharacterized protein LOC108097276 [Drosophila ficusphila]